MVTISFHSIAWSSAFFGTGVCRWPTSPMPWRSLNEGIPEMIL